MKEDNMENSNDIFMQVEKFIQDLLDGNKEVIYARAKHLQVFTDKEGRLGSIKREVEGTLPDLLGTAITNYQAFKNNPVLKLRYADQCFQYIVWAHTHSIIRNTGLLYKIKDLQKDNLQLKEEKDKYQKEIARLNQLVEALHETMDNFGGRIESGDDLEHEGNEE